VDKTAAAAALAVTGPVASAAASRTTAALVRRPLGVISEGLQPSAAILAAAPWDETRWSSTSRVGSAPAAAPVTQYTSICMYVYMSAYLSV